MMLIISSTRPVSKAVQAVWWEWRETTLAVGVPLWVSALSGGCRHFCVERPRLPRARYSRFQPAPANPPQGTAHLISQPSGASGKTFLRKDETLHGSEEWGTNCEEQPCEHWGQRRRGGAEIPLQPTERPWWSRYPHCTSRAGGYFLKKLQPMGGTPLRSRQKVWGGRNSSEEPLQTDHNPPFPILFVPVRAGGRSRSQGWRCVFESGKKGWVGEGILGFVFVSHYPNLF